MVEAPVATIEVSNRQRIRVRQKSNKVVPLSAILGNIYIVYTIFPERIKNAKNTQTIYSCFTIKMEVEKKARSIITQSTN